MSFFIGGHLVETRSLRGNPGSATCIRTRKSSSRPAKGHLASFAEEIAPVEADLLCGQLRVNRLCLQRRCMSEQRIKSAAIIKTDERS
jgi:hypothetical protein